ncbi:Protein fam72a, partial [Coemansia nantahalensis]
MEAVVMARPAIRCYSTDLPPLGCDVVHQPVAPALADMILGAGCTTCSSLTHHARRFDLAPSGPCDCHVQDIACLGCGNLVGYYIHRPCFRCLAQRLRIKQRGFQHLWTFYQDNVAAVQRENELGDPVGWEEL